MNERRIDQSLRVAAWTAFLRGDTVEQFCASSVIACRHEEMRRVYYEVAIAPMQRLMQVKSDAEGWAHWRERTER